jgi:hypothetical protein
MAKITPRVPLGLIIPIVVLLILGAVSGPIIRAVATEQQLATIVILGAIPFILVFVAIILTFISMIVLAGSIFGGNVSPQSYRIVERILIGGIVLGVVAMFQPWFFAAFKYGFMILLISLLGFILWSHLSPSRIHRQEELSTVSTGEITSSEAEV